MAGKPVRGGGRGAPPAPAGGTGLATWEWVSPVAQSPQSLQSVRFGVLLSQINPPPTAGQVTATVNLSLSPLSTTGDSANLGVPVPRFVDTSTTLPLFTRTS